ncbi:MAG: dTDP-4-dehydrorhamnose 3,5-epimerase family protein [Xanthobacteraceae bacterium]|nr:dTDP-4-dehydrorhamnose 3,5-epimerase family protein [Xanthobacteraceae bacterium]
MKFEELPIGGAFRITVETITDERGAFGRRFCADTFRGRGLEADFVQRSISFNRKAGTLRGFHFQAAPHLETRLVRCTRGAVFDVIVDLRDGSPTYGTWHAEELTEANRGILYVPKGAAHGFQAIEDDSEVDYEITPAYVPGLERGFRFDDPALSIPWPVRDIIMSDRDRALPPTHSGILL